MAYDGDADWHILIHEQSFPQSHLVEDTDQPLRTRGKFDSSLNMVSGTDNGGAAAVSVGLKARAVGPVEKIKFKEVLKRKGGLQEYLECRWVTISKNLMYICFQCCVSSVWHYCALGIVLENSPFSQ